MAGNRVRTVFCLTLLLPSIARADSITIAAASSLKFALDDLSAKYKAEHPTDSLTFVYGSSGKLQTQIREGAPFDLFFSADTEFPRTLEREGFAASPTKVFALGRIVLWSTKIDASGLSLASLSNAKIRHIAVANPKLAPYGARAEEALRAAGVFETIKRKLVFGQDVAQAAQFVQTGNAEIGIIALSLALTSEMRTKGNYSIIPSELHKPLELGFIVTKQAAKNRPAGSFAEYMLSKAAAERLTKFGFTKGP